MPLDRSQEGLSRRRRTWTSVAAVGFGLFLAGTLVAPAMQAAGVPGSGWARLPFVPFCHQIAARSLEIAGFPAAVCARCLGLYLGAFLALTVAAAERSRPESAPRWLFFALCAPTVLDALAPSVGLPGLPNGPRFLLALPTGFVLGWFLAAGIRDWAAMGYEKRTSAEAGSASSGPA